MKANMRLILTAAVLCCLLPACGASVSPESSPAIAQTAVSSEPTFTLGADVNPYTGFPKGESYPEGVRGVAVMINNVKTALPQSGINSADLVYEMVTEGGLSLIHI